MTVRALLFLLLVGSVLGPGASLLATVAGPEPGARLAALLGGTAGGAVGGTAAVGADTWEDALELNQKAKAALERGQAAEAVLYLESARKLAPEDEVLARNLGYAYFLRGKDLLAAFDWEGAVADYGRAADLVPEQPMYRLHMANLLLQRYRLEEALAQADRTIATAPETPDAHALRGDVLNLLDRLPEALEAYAEAERRLAAEPAEDGGGEAAAVDAEGRARLAERVATAKARTERQHAVERDYTSDRTRFFTVRHPLETDVLRLTDVLDRARADVCNLFDHHTGTRALVVVYPPDDFRRVTGTHEWVGGLFDRKIRLPLADPDTERARIEQAFRHEFTHLLVTEMAPGCPAFLNEGLAQLAEYGRGEGMDRLVAWLDGRGRPRESLPRLSELPDSFLSVADPETVHEGYLLSHAFLDHVVSQHGLARAVRWARLSAQEPLADAFKAAVGRPLAQEEELFRELVRTARG